MEEDLMQEITIYHKTDNGYARYIKKASYRDTSILNHNRNGNSSTSNAIIRIFDIKGYKDTWNVSKNDIIVNKAVYDEITGNTPATELTKIYGQDAVLRIMQIDIYDLIDEDLKELNHIKLGCV